MGCVRMVALAQCLKRATLARTAEIAGDVHLLAIGGTLNDSRE